MIAPPKDRPLLILARWDWAGMQTAANETIDSDRHWRVAKWDENGYWTETENPYSDLACDITDWRELPACAKEN